MEDVARRLTFSKERGRCRQVDGTSRTPGLFDSRAGEASSPKEAEGSRSDEQVVVPGSFALRQSRSVATPAAAAAAAASKQAYGTPWLARGGGARTRAASSTSRDVLCLSTEGNTKAAADMSRVSATDPEAWTPPLERMLEGIQSGLHMSLVDETPSYFEWKQPCDPSEAGIGFQNGRNGSRANSSSRTESSFVNRAQSDDLSPVTSRIRQPQVRLPRGSVPRTRNGTSSGALIQSQSLGDDQHRRRGTRFSNIALDTKIATRCASPSRVDTAHPKSQAACRSTEASEELQRLRAEITRLRSESDAWRRACVANAQANTRLRQRLRHFREQLDAVLRELRSHEQAPPQHAISSCDDE